MNKIIRSNTKSPEIKQTTKSTDPTREIKISKKEKKKETLYYLGRNTTDVETGTAERAALLDTGGLETKLGSFNGGHIAAGAATNYNDVVFIRSSRGETPREGSERERIPQNTT